jgi:hypothetical protein
MSRVGRQPIWLAEVGSATVGGDKEAWVRDMFRRAKSMRRLKAIVWMDTVEDGMFDWRARSPANVAAAFRVDDRVATAALALRASRRVRVGRRAVVRWSTPAEALEDVERWRIYLNGKRVRTLSAHRKRVLRKKVTHKGRYRWTVKGIDAQGDSVLSSSRRFRVVHR